MSYAPKLEANIAASAVQVAPRRLRGNKREVRMTMDDYGWLRAIGFLNQRMSFSL